VSCLDIHPGTACTRSRAADAAAEAGKPELAVVLAAGYCPPNRCYCGGCPRPGGAP